MNETRTAALLLNALLPPRAACGDITVLPVSEAQCGMDGFHRRDVFECVLVISRANELHYTTRSYLVDRPALVFTNRLAPYSLEPAAGTTEEAEGYLVGFAESFLYSAMRGVSLKDSAKPR